MGRTLVRHGLARARYDSRDGYQWHPREVAYRAEEPVEVAADGGCRATNDRAAFVSRSSLEDQAGSDENRRHQLLTTVIARPRVSAARILPTLVRETRTEDREVERRRREAAEQREREWQAELERLARQRAEAEQDSSDSSGGGYPGYTGPRCYAPGGKTWKPC